MFELVIKSTHKIPESTADGSHTRANSLVQFGAKIQI